MHVVGKSGGNSGEVEREGIARTPRSSRGNYEDEDVGSSIRVVARNGPGDRAGGRGM